MAECGIQMPVDAPLCLCAMELTTLEPLGRSLLRGRAHRLLPRLPAATASFRHDQHGR
jgi:hypothetical protein